MIRIDSLNIIKSCSNKIILDFALSIVNLSKKEQLVIDAFIENGFDVDEEVSSIMQDKYKYGYSLKPYRKYKKSALKKINDCWNETKIKDLLKGADD